MMAAAIALFLASTVCSIMAMQRGNSSFDGLWWHEGGETFPCALLCHDDLRVASQAMQQQATVIWPVRGAGAMWPRDAGPEPEPCAVLCNRRSLREGEGP
jgi:hypothetical protein